MRHTESSPSDSSRLRQPRWATIAFYSGLLLLLAALNYLQGGGDGALQDRPPIRTLPAAERKKPHDEPAAAGEVLTEQRHGDQSDPTARTTDREAASPPRPSRTSGRQAIEQDGGGENPLLVRNVRILDQDHRIVYRGDVDLAPTLNRIEKGVRLRFPNDGSVFQNRERRLPAKPSGYYHEFVHPTPGVSGPGAQRMVLGRDGEVYYTSDHYRSFRRIQ